MKILKIELQNINSLKSTKPIVIDFEGDAFKDIGLFAITGPTGAGKTTILDAIMIALYHKIPRLNVLGTGALEMAISHGSTKAFVTLDFENNHVRYQAHWSVETTTKTGKVKKNPTHYFSFKNLSTGEIIASDKKTAVLEAIEQVVTLTADQFLRSVLLAQGEFAAFLNAKGSEKAKLLEQITGEEIYNQIGKQTQERKAREEKELERISGKINLDDLISPEEKQVLKEDVIKLKSENISSNQLQKRYIEIENWYINQKELSAKKEHLTKELSAFEVEKEKVNDELHKLVQNKLAEPFRLLINQLKENEQASEQQQYLLKVHESHLKEAKTQNDSHASVIDVAQQKERNIEKEYASWQPILQELVEIENELSVTTSNRNEKKSQFDKAKSTLQNIEDQKKKTKEKAIDLHVKVDEINNYLENKKVIPAVEKHFSDWKVKLIQLKGKKEIYVNELVSSDKNRLEIEECTKNLEVHKKEYSAITKQSELIQQNVDQLTLSLANNDIQTIIEAKERNQKSVMQWQTFQGLSADFIRTKKLLEVDQNKKITLQEEKLKVEKRNTHLEQKKQVEQELLDKAIMILEQQKLIQKYEKDRLGLKKNEPCFVCGSTTHPYVEKYAAPKISSSEKEVTEKTRLLESTKVELQEIQKDLVELSTKTEMTNDAVLQQNDKLKTILLAAKELAVTCSIEDVITIELELNNLLESEYQFVKQVESNTSLQKKKELVEAELKTIALKERQKNNECVRVLNNLDSLKEKQSISTQNIQKLDTEIQISESELTKSLAPFKMKVPTPERTDEILETIETGIAEYQIKKQKGQQLEKELSNLQVVLSTEEGQITELKTQLDKLHNESELLNQLLNEQSNKRVLLLPIHISIQEKRNEIETLKESAEKELDIATKTRFELEQTHAKQLILVQTYQTQLTSIKLKSAILNKEVNALLDESEFEEKVDVETALLSLDKKEELTLIKEKLHNKETELKTLEIQLNKDFEKALGSKDFEESAEEINELQAELQSQLSKNNHRLGEINQLFTADDKLRRENREQVVQKDKQQQIVNKWQTLYRLLGGSKEAFNTYVQRITLKNLLLLANLHLFKLNKRYELFMDNKYEAGRELEFAMIDRYHNDQVRATDTASGGEKFLISLALALGLADLTSRNMTIDSLFIDEGFGTLDPDSLESAMHTLETLQSEGKLIGVISHVENLKERISTQVQVNKKNNGVSEVRIVY